MNCETITPVMSWEKNNRKFDISHYSEHDSKGTIKEKFDNRQKNQRITKEEKTYRSTNKMQKR